MGIYTFNQAVKKEGVAPTEVVSLGTLTPPTTEIPEEKNGLLEFGKGVVKGAISNTQALGKTALEVASFGKIDTDKLGVSEERLKSQNKAQLAGKITEGIAEFLLPIGGSKAATVASNTFKATRGAVVKSAEAVAETAPKVLRGGAKAFLGEADTQIVKSGQNPMVELFKTGKKRVSDVVGGIEKGIQKFETTSKAQLQAVKEAIPEIPLDVQEVATRVNQGVMNSIQHSADYKGIRHGFETVDDIISSGILKPEETERLQKVMQFIGKWGSKPENVTARGTLNLKEALSNFYATGENYTGSNAVVRSIQRNLVDLVSETAPEIKVALKRASGNIDKTEQFVEHLLGKDSVSGESKILTLARNLQDKAKNGIKVDLVKELEKVSGMKITQDLEGIFDYLQSAKLKAPGLQKPVETLKFLAKKAIEKKVPLK